MNDQSISARLRLLKDQNGFTSQTMADAIGMSRRTLESYMRRENAPLPGIEALRQFASLGVSLDWLVCGENWAEIQAAMIVRVSAERASLAVFTNYLQAKDAGQTLPQPEFLALEVGTQAAQIASNYAKLGTTAVQMAVLLKQTEAQSIESMRAKVQDLEQQLTDLRRATSKIDEKSAV